MAQGKKIKACYDIGKKEKYQLIEPPLGKGGFAVTYKARVLSDELKEKYGEFVAIKIPLTDEHMEYIVQELIDNTVLKFKSKYIIEFYGFTVLDKRVVMIMELANHGSLRDKLGHIGEQEPIDIDDALLISEHICEGLKVAHGSNVFHRDVKPENILITMVSKEQFVAKVGDFGISKVLNAHEYPSRVMGTPYYMAKEVFEGRAHLYSDIYSVGVVMYEMMTGRLPYDGPTYEVLRMQIYSRNPVPPMEINPGIDRQLNDIILKAISQDINVRYKTISELLKAIKDYRQRRSGHGQADHLIEAARRSYEEGKPDLYVSALKDIIKRYPGERDAYAYLGAYYNMCKLYGDAIRVFEEGVKRVPDSAALWRDMALALYAGGKKSEAIESLRKAIEVADSEDMRNAAARLLNIWDRKPAQKEDRGHTPVMYSMTGRSCAPSSPQDNEVEGFIGSLKKRYEDGEVDGYEKELKALIKKYPDSDLGYAYLGEYYNRCKRYDEAINLMESGIKNNPRSAILYRYIAFSYFGVRRKKDAIVALKKAIEFAPDENFERQMNMLLKLWGADLE